MEKKNELTVAEQWVFISQLCELIPYFDSEVDEFTARLINNQVLVSFFYSGVQIEMNCQIGYIWQSGTNESSAVLKTDNPAQSAVDFTVVRALVG